LLVKPIEFLREVTRPAGSFAHLVNPHNPNVENDAKEADSAARALGVKLVRLSVSSEPDLDSAFATLAQQGAGGFFVNPDPFFTARPDKLAALATLHRVAGIHYLPEFTAAGGLASYVTDFAEGFRQAGTYAGRILKGEKPADLPVQQLTKIALIINLKTAKALGLTVPLPLLGRADEVIE
jgi:putative ABC transport system substrate-binding protein